MAIPNKIIITGKVSIKYIDDILDPRLGDIMLLLNDDAINPVAGNYENTSSSGYIKAKIYDGLVWQNIDIREFCLNRENKFAKKQRAIDSAILCQGIIKEYKGQIMYRTYRGHFTMEEYEPGQYITKANRGRK